MGITKVSIVDSSGPSKVDRDLVVVLYVKNMQGSDAMAYRYHVRLAEGQSKAQVEIPFTSAESYMSWDVGVFEEGRDIEDRRKRGINSNQLDFQLSYNNYQTGNQFSIAGLLASNADAKVESRNLKVVNEFLATKIPQVANPFPQPGTVLAPNSMIPIANASEDWRSYFPYPVWAASVDAVAEINEQQPHVASALRTYVSAGGMLLIYNVQSSKSMSTVNQLLSSTGGNAELASWKSIAKSAPAWWIIDTDPIGISADNKGVKDQVVSRPLTSAGAVNDTALLTDTLLETGLGGHRDNIIGVMEALGFEGIPLNQLAEGRQRIMTALGSDTLLQREYACGRVVVCSKPLHELLSDQIDSFVQMNDDEAICTLTSQSHDGNWFWQNLILQVGKPPVMAFCVIVALFGALLGPGLLIFTGHLKRRSLMIFLVPAVSLAATLAIFSYGLLYEGFETHVRIHSVTAFDGPARVAFGWSRQNYFSGMPPREGLQFHTDTYVRSVYSDDTLSYRTVSDPRTGLTGTVTVGEKQIWNSWLKPRQHQQLLVGHRVDPSSIPISTERTPAGKLMLKNLTAAKLPLVVLRGAKDDYYVETDLGPNESREPEAQDLASVAVIVGKVGVDFKPRIPLELDGGSDSLLNFANPRRYARSYQTQAKEIIREAFARYMTDDLKLEPHAFATLVPEFDAIEVPLNGIQSDNVNLVIGVEPW
jgi:hypothetical protein